MCAQTKDEMRAELLKLGKAQREVMRKLVVGDLEALTVKRCGWLTVVDVVSGGFRSVVRLGARGRIINRSVEPVR